MLRRMIVPLFVIFAVAGVATMCTAVTGAKARRRLQQQRFDEARHALDGLFVVRVEVGVVHRELRDLLARSRLIGVHEQVPAIW